MYLILQSFFKNRPDGDVNVTPPDCPMIAPGHNIIDEKEPEATFMPYISMRGGTQWYQSEK
jgi:hypothetical protein